mmetsp:Transcript_62727/g.125692  ORF Transcript_62727/g.125692 Transcript_62727/m.125692 type:complete len:248 (+) Transcript_62727:773-1516(+)
MCWDFLVMAPNTPAKQLRDLLMFCASSSAFPVTPLLSTLSDPARSTRLSCPRRTAFCSSFLAVKWRVKMEWLRLDSAFMSVFITVRFLLAIVMMFSTSSLFCGCTSIFTTFSMSVIPYASRKMRKRGGVSDSLRRSRSTSLYTSTNVTCMLNVHPCASRLVLVVPTCSMERGMIPRIASCPAPCMLCVLPLPVCPYENKVTLYPSKADCTNSETSANTSSCPSCAAKERSKLKLIFPALSSFAFDGS